MCVSSSLACDVDAVCVCVHVCVCVCACVRPCVRACVRAAMHTHASSASRVTLRTYLVTLCDLIQVASKLNAFDVDAVREHLRNLIQVRGWLASHTHTHATTHTALQHAQARARRQRPAHTT